MLLLVFRDFVTSKSCLETGLEKHNKEREKG